MHSLASVASSPRPARASNSPISARPLLAFAARITSCAIPHDGCVRIVQTIEEVARKELGLIRPGEVLVYLQDIKPAK